MSASNGYIPQQALDAEWAKREYISGGLGIFSDTVESNYFGVAATELIRDHVPQLRSEAVTPVDVFAFERGAPRAPYHTKIGGRPYRSPDAPWPMYVPTNEEAFFVAQICFSDSQDVVKDLALPGDVMLIYAAPDHDHLRGYDFPIIGSHEDDGMQVEWVTLSEELTKAVTMDGSRSNRPTIVEYRGLRHRSSDYLAPDRAASFVLSTWRSELQPWDADERHWAGCAVRERKFKIGGLSCFDEVGHRSKVLGTHFAGFGEFDPTSNQIQWRQEGRPVGQMEGSFEEWDFRDGLRLSDSHRAEFFVDDVGATRFVVDCPL